jgi:exonuclease I
MVSTSRRLRKQFGDKQVDTILRRFSARRYLGNKYQEIKKWNYYETS